MSNQILGEAARRMLPVLAGRVLAAVTDRAVEKVDELADRLSERSGSEPRTPAPAEGESRVGAAFAFLVEQAPWVVVDGHHRGTIASRADTLHVAVREAAPPAPETAKGR